MNRYKITGRIGQGAHGYVMKGTDRTTLGEVALKKLQIKTLEEGIPKNIMREIMALSVLKSEYIVQLLEVLPHGMSLVLVMEYLPSSLMRVLKDPNLNLSVGIVKTYSKMLLSGVSFMHANGVMHRDLKPANLLVSNEGALKIADFGLARIFTSDGRQYSHQVATRWYRAPELLYGSRSYTETVDLWAVGCIVAEMFLKKPLFPGETDIEQLAIVLHTLGTPTVETWPGLKDLPDYNKIAFAKSPGLSWGEILPGFDRHIVNFVKAFVRYDYKKRLTAKQGLCHTFFTTPPLCSNIDKMPKPKDIQEETLLDVDSDVYSDFEKLISGF